MRTHLAISILSVSLLSLAACKGAPEGKVQYQLTFTGSGAAMQSDLQDASLRVMQSRVEALGGKVISKSIQPEGDKIIMTAVLSDPALTLPLTDGLTAPFTFRIMRQAEASEKADITVERFGGFMETGFTEKDIAWLSAGNEEQATTGAVSIQLMPTGKTTLQSIFKQYKGKMLGIFVRGRLVSQLTDPGEVQDSILISGIPSAAIAKMFADDVDVSLYVRFQPVQN